MVGKWSKQAANGGLEIGAELLSDEKAKWWGPFEPIARQLFTELADRHTRSIETHAIKPSDALYGLKPTTRLRAR